MEIFFICFIISLGIYGYISEKRDWNNGISKYDGTNWKHFDTNSQGGRGYTDKSNNYIWISYPFID